ncbi:hypothetical protein AX14_002672 [Amanita brunnescens Koide BX004]|nr:hypothetical protein AX14_002672 [Amanita brunnescens Koide BX004]
MSMSTSASEAQMSSALVAPPFRRGRPTFGQAMFSTTTSAFGQKASNTMAGASPPSSTFGLSAFGDKTGRRVVGPPLEDLQLSQSNHLLPTKRN